MMPAIVNTRAAFGLNGNFLAAFISWLSASGWVAVNSVLAVFALVEIAGVFGLGTGTGIAHLGKGAHTGTGAVSTGRPSWSMCWGFWRLSR